jgi:4-hydroxy-3-polyprenylbenzoate decarboxylase
VSASLPRVVLGVTGASGSIYGARLLAHLRAAGTETHLVLSRTATLVAAHEGISFPKSLEAGTEGLPGSVIRHAEEDLFAAPASGSFRHRGMVIAPCSAGTVGRIASGISDTLLTRAADVCLKERRPLVIVLRETPLNRIHLRNMLALEEAGALIMPASPSFYSAPSSIDALVDTVLARALDHLGVDLEVSPRWRES